MRVYRVRELDLEIPRSDIVAMKKLVKVAGSPGYSEMLRLMSHPTAIARYCMVPGTNLLRWLLNTCILGSRLLIVLAIVLAFWRLWWWCLGLVVFSFLVLSPVQTAVNYEIGARLLILDQHLHLRTTELSEEEAESNAADNML